MAGSLVEISDLTADSGFDVFVSALSSHGQVKGLRAPGCAAYSRRQLDELQEIIRGGGARGSVFIAIAEGLQLRTPLSRYLGAEQLAYDRVNAWGGEPGDLLILVADQPAVVAVSLDRVRRELGRRLKLAAHRLAGFCLGRRFPDVRLE